MTHEHGPAAYGYPQPPLPKHMSMGAATTLRKVHVILQLVSLLLIDSHEPLKPYYSSLKIGKAETKTFVSSESRTTLMLTLPDVVFASCKQLKRSMVVKGVRGQGLKQELDT